MKKLKAIKYSKSNNGDKHSRDVIFQLKLSYKFVRLESSGDCELAIHYQSITLTMVLILAQVYVDSTFQLGCQQTTRYSRIEPNHLGCLSSCHSLTNTTFNKQIGPLLLVSHANCSISWSQIVSGSTQPIGKRLQKVYTSMHFHVLKWISMK